MRLADPKVIGVGRSTSGKNFNARFSFEHNLGLRVRLAVAEHCDWRCTMVTCSQEVSTTQLWRRMARPVCFDLRKTGPGSNLMLNVELSQGHNGQTHLVRITHHLH